MQLQVAARSSKLSQIQAVEVLSELRQYVPEVRFSFCYVKTIGDLDRKTSLRSLGKTDFFTKELDQMLLNHECRITIHSAKDLPDPIPEGLEVIAITKGVDPSDSLVYCKEAAFDANCVIAVSSERREEAVRKLFPSVKFCDIRGTIEERLSQIDGKKIHGAVIAEAALIRLGLTHLERIRLPGETTALQGQLAVIARKNDLEMQKLFLPLDTRQKSLYLGLDPSNYSTSKYVIHYPVIKTKRRQVHFNLEPFTHVIFTSKVAVKYFPQLSKLQDKTVVAIGEATANLLRENNIEPLVAKSSTQEGIIELLSSLDLKKANIFYPRSSKARANLVEYLEKRKVSFEVVDLYDTEFIKQKEWNLDYFDEVVFTSPSTVDGFFNIYEKIPIQLHVKTIGPITNKYLVLQVS